MDLLLFLSFTLFRVISSAEENPAAGLMFHTPVLELIAFKTSGFAVFTKITYCHSI